VSTPTNTRLPPIATTVTHGLLASPRKSLNGMREHGFLPYSPSYAARTLANTIPDANAIKHRANNAPPDAFLAVDLTPAPHAGQSMQGVDFVYSSVSKRPILGLEFVSSALVYASGIDPIPLRLEPFISPNLQTDAFPSRTPTQALLDTVQHVRDQGVKFKATVVDAGFVTKEALEKLNVKGVPIIGRIRTNLIVEFEAERVRIGALAQRFRPGKARYYPRFDWYAKRVKVKLSGVGEVDLIVCWRRIGGERELFVLVSTLVGGVQELLGAWRHRWDLECLHRLYKQNLGLGACQARSFSSQVRWVDLVVQAALLARAERLVSPGLAWRVAQARAAAKLEKAVLTGGAGVLV
jgi:DDE superfamily endonuclease